MIFDFFRKKQEKLIEKDKTKLLIVGVFMVTLFVLMAFLNLKVEDIFISPEGAKIAQTLPENCKTFSMTHYGGSHTYICDSDINSMNINWYEKEIIRYTKGNSSLQYIVILMIFGPIIYFLIRKAYLKN